MTPLATVEAFIAAWNRMDLEAIVAALSDDVHYHNIPLEPIDGRDAVRRYLEGAWQFSECRWTLTHAAAAGDVVLTERVDAFVINGHDVVLPVMGTFEIRDGRIAAWRDYFDLATYRAQLRSALPQS